MAFFEFFWSDEIWFSNKTTGEPFGWNDFSNQREYGKYFPLPYDLIWSIPFGILMVGLRRVLQTNILVKLGYYVGVPRKKDVKFEECHVLEQAYRKARQRDKRTLEALTKQTDMSVRQIEIWFRKRAKKDVLTDIQRFTESSWHLLVRGSSFLIGLILLWNKPWFWETRHAWIGWPNHPVSADIHRYYIFEFSIYWHLVFNLFLDHKRKDFWLSAVHHFCTIILMYFCWILNFVRIGTLILLVHDASDPWVDLGKILVYSKKKRSSEIVFVIFIFVWLVSKDGIYPFILLYSTTFEACKYLPITNFMLMFFNVLLYILQILHIMWTYNIYEVLMNKLKHGELKDVRSDSEKDDEVSSEFANDE